MKRYCRVGRKTEIKGRSARCNDADLKPGREQVAHFRPIEFAVEFSASAGARPGACEGQSRSFPASESVLRIP